MKVILITSSDKYYKEATQLRFVSEKQRFVRIKQ